MVLIVSRNLEFGIIENNGIINVLHPLTFKTEIKADGLINFATSSLNSLFYFAIK
ncbi:MAG: hypothetical protein ACI94Y_004425 [Maribacter sp.]|jgi:hypothetical protein